MSANDPKRTFSTGRISPPLDRGPVGNHLSTTHIIIGEAQELGGLMAEAMRSSKPKG